MSGTKNLLKDLPLDDPKRIAGEKARRFYVKRKGGLVKDLSKTQIEEANKLCAEYGRPAKDGWDKYVTIGAMGVLN